MSKVACRRAALAAFDVELRHAEKRKPSTHRTQALVSSFVNLKQALSFNEDVSDGSFDAFYFDAFAAFQECDAGFGNPLPDCAQRDFDLQCAQWIEIMDIWDKVIARIQKAKLPVELLALEPDPNITTAQRWLELEARHTSVIVGSQLASLISRSMTDPDLSQQIFQDLLAEAMILGRKYHDFVTLCILSSEWLRCVADSELGDNLSLRLMCAILEAACRREGELTGLEGQNYMLKAVVHVVHSVSASRKLDRHRSESELNMALGILKQMKKQSLGRARDAMGWIRSNCLHLLEDCQISLTQESVSQLVDNLAEPDLNPDRARGHFRRHADCLMRFQKTIDKRKGIKSDKGLGLNSLVRRAMYENNTKLAHLFMSHASNPSDEQVMETAKVWKSQFSLQPKSAAPGSFMHARLVSAPIAAKERFVSVRCSFCGAKPCQVKFKYCGGCKAMQYCGAACQNSHWNAGHRDECSAIQSFDGLGL